MDSRIDEHARILVEQCLDVQAGDDHEQNECVLHIDVIVDVSDGSVVEVDREVMEVSRLKPRPLGRGYSRQLLH